MTTASIIFGSATALTIGLATGPLASDTSLLAGRESTAIDNTSDLAIDAIVFGKVTTGTTPTASRQIEVWLYGSVDGTNFSGGASGSDANLSPQAKDLFRLLQMIPTNNTSNQAYTWGPFSVAQAFGGTMPANWGVYIVHNTGAALNATGGNHFVKYRTVKYTSV